MTPKLVSGMFALAMFIIPGIVMAYDNQVTTDAGTHMATGCLGKGSTANNYMLTDEDGKLWDLRGQNVQLGPHVGHMVTVTGTIPKASRNDSAANTSPQNHLVVTNVKMVRDNCKRS